MSLDARVVAARGQLWGALEGAVPSWVNGRNGNLLRSARSSLQMQLQGQVAAGKKLSTSRRCGGSAHRGARCGRNSARVQVRSSCRYTARAMGVGSLQEGGRGAEDDSQNVASENAPLHRGESRTSSEARLSLKDSRETVVPPFSAMYRSLPRQPQTHRECGGAVRGHRREPGGWIRRSFVCSALVWIIYSHRQRVVRGETAEGSGACQPRGDRFRRTEAIIETYGPLEGRLIDAPEHVPQVTGAQTS